MSSETAHVSVYIVTYRRPELLRRAIKSVLNQTHPTISVYVVNDAPDDDEPSRIVRDIGDPRVVIFEPVLKRGATANFNLVFEDTESDFSALLEDDNWWEPEFLASQIESISHFPEAPIIVGNETIWREQTDGSWLCTDRTIWPFRDLREHHYKLTDVCGHALICNSSMVVRTRRSSSLVTPTNIPVDVTEHFRERLLPISIPLNGKPLVNYAETISTARDKGPIWSKFQIALIGSVFASLTSQAARRRLAFELWAGVDSALSPRAGCLIDVGIAIPEARPLLRQAPLLSLAKALAGYIKSPSRLKSAIRSRRDLDQQINFLISAPLTRQLATRFETELQNT